MEVERVFSLALLAPSRPCFLPHLPLLLALPQKVIFGDGSRPAVLEAAGVHDPQAFVVCHRNKEQVGSGGEGECEDEGEGGGRRGGETGLEQDEG